MLLYFLGALVGSSITQAHKDAWELKGLGSGETAVGIDSVDQFKSKNSEDDIWNIVDPYSPDYAYGEENLEDAVGDMWDLVDPYSPDAYEEKVGGEWLDGFALPELDSSDSEDEVAEDSSEESKWLKSIDLPDIGDSEVGLAEDSSDERFQEGLNRLLDLAEVGVGDYMDDHDYNDVGTPYAKGSRTSDSEDSQSDDSEDSQSDSEDYTADKYDSDEYSDSDSDDSDELELGGYGDYRDVGTFYGAGERSSASSESSDDSESDEDDTGDSEDDEDDTGDYESDDSESESDSYDADDYESDSDEVAVGLPSWDDVIGALSESDSEEVVSDSESVSDSPEYDSEDSVSEDNDDSYDSEDDSYDSEDYEDVVGRYYHEYLDDYKEEYLAEYPELENYDEHWDPDDSDEAESDDSDEEESGDSDEEESDDSDEEESGDSDDSYESESDDSESESGDSYDSSDDDSDEMDDVEKDEAEVNRDMDEYESGDSEYDSDDVSDSEDDISSDSDSSDSSEYDSQEYEGDISDSRDYDSRDYYHYRDYDSSDSEDDVSGDDRTDYNDPNGKEYVEEYDIPREAENQVSGNDWVEYDIDRDSGEDNVADRDWVEYRDYDSSDSDDRHYNRNDYVENDRAEDAAISSKVDDLIDDFGDDQSVGKAENIPWYDIENAMYNDPEERVGDSDEFYIDLPTEKDSTIGLYDYTDTNEVQVGYDFYDATDEIAVGTAEDMFDAGGDEFYVEIPNPDPDAVSAESEEAVGASEEQLQMILDSLDELDNSESGVARTIKDVEDKSAGDAQTEEDKTEREAKKLEDGVVEPFEAEEKRAEQEAYKDEQGVEDYIKKAESRSESDIRKYEERAAADAKRYEEGVERPQLEHERKTEAHIKKAEEDASREARESERYVENYISKHERKTEEYAHNVEEKAEREAKADADKNELVSDDDDSSEVGETYTLGDVSGIRDFADERQEDYEEGIAGTVDVGDYLPEMQSLLQDYYADDEVAVGSSLMEFDDVSTDIVMKHVRHLMPWGAEEDVGSSVLPDVEPFEEDELALLTIVEEKSLRRRRLFFKMLFQDFGEIGRKIYESAMAFIERKMSESTSWAQKWRRLRAKITHKCEKSQRFRRALRGRVLAKIRVFGKQLKKHSGTKILAERSDDAPVPKKTQQAEADFREDEERGDHEPEAPEDFDEVDERPQRHVEEQEAAEEGSEKEHDPDEDDYLESELAEPSLPMLKPHFVQKDGFDYGEIMLGSGPDEAVVNTKVVMDAIDYLLPWRETSVGQTPDNMAVEPFTLSEIAELMIVTSDDGDILPEYRNLAIGDRRRLFVFGFLGKFGRAVVRGCREAIQEKLDRDDTFAHKFLKMLKVIRSKIQKVVRNTIDRQLKGSRLFRKIKKCASKLQERAYAMYREYQRDANGDNVEFIPITKTRNKVEPDDDYTPEEGEAEDADDLYSEEEEGDD